MAEIKEEQRVALLVTPLFVSYFDKNLKSNPSFDRQKSNRDNDNRDAIVDDIRPETAPIITKYCIPSKCFVINA